MQKELDVIIDLMHDLQDKMQYGEEDLSERLGRKKPELEIAKVSVESEEPEMDMGDGFEEQEESPDDKLKNRLMRLRE